MKKRLFLILISGIIGVSLYSQKEEAAAQSRESQAMDATATQWSSQLASVKSSVILRVKVLSLQKLP